MSLPLARRSKATAAALLALFLVALSASGQEVLGLEALWRIDTAHFSIYYPASLEAQASRLSDFADETYARLSDLLGIAGSGGRIPVLLSDAGPDLNGYYTPYPSERILIYPRGARAGESLASLGDELRSVFLHELVHALSIARRGPFWGFLAALAGDYIVPSAWTAPDSLIEGTAVWAESLDGRNGRLNDPAALESVYLDLAAGRKRGLWEASGLADYPGSGGLPYYYGALFALYLEESFGRDSIARLWKEAAKGDFLVGFEGGLFGPGALERAVGRPARELWPEFLAWLAAGAEKGSAPAAAAEAGAASDGKAPAASGPEALELGSRRIGPFAAGAGVLYYYDAELKAVFSRPLGTAGPRRRLFDADSRLETMALSPDGDALLLDWARTGADGAVEAIACRYLLAAGRLEILGPRETSGTGGATANLVPGAALRLETRLGPDSQGRFYGLARFGPKVLPVRIDAAGRAEVADPGPWTLRSMSLGRPTVPDGSEGAGQALGGAGAGPAETARLVLSAVPKGGISRPALLDPGAATWTLWVSRTAPEGGARDPILDGAELVFRSEGAGGLQSLRRLRLDGASLARDFQSLQGPWIDLEAYRRTAGPQEPEKAPPTDGRARPAPAGLFPRVLSAARYPWTDGEAAGIGALGSDLTGRLSWSALAAWDFRRSLPEASLSLGLDLGAQSLALSASDKATSSGTKSARWSTASLSYAGSLAFLPYWKRLGFGATGWLAGLDSDYSLAEFASPSWDRAQGGGRASLSFSTMRSQAFPPYDPRGFEARLGGDYETILGGGSGWSLFGSLAAAAARPSISFRLYGAISPDSSLAFLPAGRVLRRASPAAASAAAPPYPLFSEYAGATGLSPWYLFAEAAVRLADIELWEATGGLRSPPSPPFGLRRIVLRAGARAAAWEAPSSSSTTILVPAAAFLRAETDAALLAGILACGHLELSAEVSYAFDSALPGGGLLHFAFGAGVSY